LAWKNAQYALAGGICTHWSDEGYLLIRQTTDPGNCCGYSTENPAACSAPMAVPGSPEAHLVLIEPPLSTTTVTPEVPEQAAALAGDAAATSPRRARPQAAAAPARREAKRDVTRVIRRAPPGGAC
jgi:hypothetical protein